MRRVFMVLDCLPVLCCVRFWGVCSNFYVLLAWSLLLAGCCRLFKIVLHCSK